MRRLDPLTPRQVNLWLAIAVVGLLVTGVTSWAIGSGWVRWWTFTHAVFGLQLLVLAPLKITTSVRTGMKRGRPSRSTSIAFGVLLVATIVLGLAHSTGVWTGVGTWSPFWMHVLFGFVAAVPFAWHVTSRPVRPTRTDLDRRFVLGGSLALGAATAAVATTELVLDALGGTGAARRATGSHEVGSHDPDAMPTVSWIDDTAPRGELIDWTVRIADRRLGSEELAAVATGHVDAVLDCTGGWWAEQTWQVVPVAELLSTEELDSRSFEVVSVTGFRRRFPMADAGSTYLAVGYEGRPLRRGHGAPVRVVAPNRRGPWWVKWVVRVEPSNRPWWLQSPFPLT